MKRIALILIVAAVIALALAAPALAADKPTSRGTQHCTMWAGSGAGNNHAGTQYWMLTINVPATSARLTVAFADGTWRTFKPSMSSTRVFIFRVTASSRVRWAQATWYASSRIARGRLSLIAWDSGIGMSPNGPAHQPPLYSR